MVHQGMFRNNYINSAVTKYYQKYCVRSAIFKQPQEQGAIFLSQITTSV